MFGRVCSEDFSVAWMAISTNHGLYMAAEETLKAFGQWLCKKCMDLYAPSNKELGTEVTEWLVLDAELLNHVFKVPITTIKCIHYGFRLAFSQALKLVLCKVVAQPNYVDVWVSTESVSSSGVALYCDDTIKSLEAKHPYKPPPSMSNITFSMPPLVAKINNVSGFIKAFPKVASCGRDGLRAQHILDALCRDGSATAINLLKVITSVVSLWLAERVSGGTEAVLHSVNSVLSEYHNDGSLAMLTVDFSNAFNLVDRSALLHEEEMELENIQTSATAMLPILKHGSSTPHIPGLVTANEKIQKKNDVKARSMLLMALPNEHLMTFNQYKDAKSLFDAITTRFGENDATRKTQKTLLKQMYKNYSAQSTDASNNDDVSTVFEVSTASPQVSTANLSDATVKKITINGSDTASYDKAKVEYFNCHKMGHFAKECKVPRNQENKIRNKKTTRRIVNVEDTSSKEMVEIDGVGFDWSYMADDEAPTNMAFMDFSDSKVYTDNTFSKTCMKNYETLKTQYDELRVEFNKSECNLANYKRGLTSVEEQLVHYKKNESLLNENITVLKWDILIKNSEIVVLKSKLEKISKEKDDFKIKIEKFENASLSLDKLIRSQIIDKSKRGLGYVSYNAVPPPHIKRFSPPKIDLSHTSLPEFVEPSVESYGVKPIEVESEREDEVESPPKIERKTIKPSMDKAEVDIPKQNDKPARTPVKYAKMYRTQRPRGEAQQIWLSLILDKKMIKYELSNGLSKRYHVVPYGELNGIPVALWLGDTHIWSATRVQQGDPLGPLLFALILRDPLLHKRGPLLEIQKRSSLGVKLLGGAICRDAYFIIGLAIMRAVNAVDLMSLLSQLHDPQMVCGGSFFEDLQWQLPSLPIRLSGLGLYSAKVVSSYAFIASRAQSWVLQDHILRDSGICGMDDNYVSALACLCDTIPRFGFSGFSNKDTTPSKAQQTLANVFFSEMVRDMEVHFDMTLRKKAIFKCLRGPHAQDFLLAIPINGLGKHIPLVEYRTILKYRLMISLFSVDAICPLCRKACLHSFGEHAVNCKELSGFNPFAFDTFGFLAPEAVELLSRVQLVMHNNVMTHRSTDVIFKCIDSAIQKEQAA
uniref:Reverse transcriptase domain-containing protein n=1 Tax=Tanacetum cinerariifolium TaxID=118510 RepID=A0A6L2NPH3_TANCI|nr:hypothetical protein [Tanacetum cinerariifolium]